MGIERPSGGWYDFNMTLTIDTGLPSESWERYHRLIEKRRAETLTLEEQSELIQLSDRIEELNVERMAALAELARLRRKALPDLLHQLAIRPGRMPDEC
jgi:hypothetical protein